MYSIGKVYARLIYINQMTINDVPKRYQQITRTAFYDLYGYELEG